MQLLRNRDELPELPEVDHPSRPCLSESRAASATAAVSSAHGRSAGLGRPHAASSIIAPAMAPESRSPRRAVAVGRPTARKNAILAAAGPQIDPQLDAAIRRDHSIYFR
ncbi:hypothetical protein N1F89_00060 [Aquibium sp. A9E412]|uniref:hypothetical protein n=1 Tax=Aquibium sp. A9E412 TaxID=2976767 RepID=UPI0025B03790|nr:hypothetical protein [Aquibium sp. A9E412]MDN2564606.1 hypothetical protein [Aquibium sp. A9E412]